MKRCSRCKESKKINDFGVDRNSKDNLNYRCKECVKEYSKIFIEKYPKKNERN